MSTITVGSAPIDVSTPASRSSVATDPDAFAAELQSATDAPTASPVTVTNPAPSAPPVASSASAGQPAASIVQPATAQPIAPIADPVPSDAAVVAPPAQPAALRPAPSSPAPAAPQVAQDVAPAVAPAPQPAPAAPLAPALLASPSGAVTTPPPVPAHRASRHSAPDALPSSTLIGAGAPLPPAAATAAPSPLATPPAAPAAGDETLPVAAVTVALAAAAPAGLAAPARRASGGASAGDDSHGDLAAGVTTPAPPVAPVPVTVLPSLAGAAPVAASSAVANAPRPAARIVTAPVNSTTDGSQAFAAALATPTTGHAASAAPVSTPAAPPSTQPLNEQLAPPLLALRTAGSGTHVLTLTVSPDAVGPVTVRAHVTGDTMRIELSAPTAQGTDALTSMLPDLKRDLAQGGMNSALTIASPNADGSAAGNQNPFGAGGSFARDDRPSYLRTSDAPVAPASDGSPRSTSARPTSVGATSALDVLA